MYPVKRCTSCKKEKTLSEFYKRKVSRDGVQSQCRTCMVKLNAVYKAGDIDKEKARQKAYRSANQEKTLAKSAAWYKNNTERAKAYSAAYRLSDPDRAKKRQAAYRSSNSVTVKAVVAKYYATNKDKYIAKNALREATKLKATPIWADLSAINRLYKDARYLTEKTGIQHHVDHVVPLRHPKVQGLHCEANLAIISGKENLSKGNRYWPDMP